MTGLFKYVRLEAGCVVAGGQGAIVPDGYVEVPEALELTALGSLMLTQDGWAARPVLASPLITTGEGGTDVTFDDCPPATAFEVTQAPSGAIVQSLSGSGRVTIRLTDPGHYRIDVQPPLPFMPLLIGAQVAE
jgi:hypothetical protein